jgi:hypothetical protein
MAARFRTFVGQRPRVRYLVLGLLVVGVLGFGTALAAGLGGTPTYTNTRTDAPGFYESIASTPQAAAPGVDPQVLASYGIFRRARTADDTLPAAVATATIGTAAGSEGANVELARHALTNGSGDGIYIVPTQGGVCLESTSGIENGCSSNAQLVPDGVAELVACGPTALPNNQADIYGLLPDGATNPVLHFVNQTSAPVRVQGNVFTVRVLLTGEPRTTQITWTGANGDQHSLPAFLPPPPPGQSATCASGAPAAPLSNP